jgi:hypothetical protein
VTVKNSVFRDKTPCSPVKVSLNFAEARRIHHQEFVLYLLYAGFLLGLNFSPEDGKNIFLRNVWNLVQYTELYLRREKLAIRLSFIGNVSFIVTALFPFCSTILF